MNKRIEVDTVFGKLFAEASHDASYPGIAVCVEREVDGDIYDRQIALIECTPDEPEDGHHALRVMLWEEDNNDDYTLGVTFFEETKPEPTAVIWDKYLQYLSEWAEDHYEPKFVGLCPLRYDEWFGSVYAHDMEGR